MAHIITHEDTTAFAPALERWCAYEDRYDGPGCPVGKGPTEAEAVADLMEQIAEADYALIAEERAA
jgi:hypothetical protein